MPKILTYFGFIVSGVLTVLVFVTAKTYIQLAIAVALYPLFAYFAFKLFPRKSQVRSVTVQTPVTTPERFVTSEPVNRERVEIVDIDKRTFLKLLGTAGISFFIFSIFGRRVEDLIFNQSNKTEVAKTGITPDSPTTETETLASEGYRISEIDDEDVISYYGFINKQGSWLIMKQDSENNSFRYSKGEKDFSKKWGGRQQLKYDYYYNLF